MSTDWTFGGTWPFEPRHFEHRDGRMHYVDEGPRDGTPVVLLHGNPTWGYLYRKIIPPLTDAGHRAIAVDHLGFGRSDKPEDPAVLTVAAHAERLAAILDSLRLERAVPVIHDWSGPIALPWVVANHARVDGLFVLNTFAPRLPGPMGSQGSIRALRTPGLGSWLVKRRAVPVEQFLFKAGVADPGRLDEHAKAAYRAPHPTAASRTALLVLPREIPLRDGGPVAASTLEAEKGMRERFGAKPVRVCWGMKDVLFGEEVLDRWTTLLPGARVTRLADAGHFVQEDAPEAVARELVEFVDGL